MRPARLLPVTEKQFQAAVVEYAELMGWRVYHTWSAIHSAPGFPDLCLVRPPQLVFAELKTEQGRLTAAQEQWAEDSRQTPAEYHLWRPSDWDAIETALCRS